MASPFGAIANIHVNEQKREATFTFADIKLQLHEDMMTVKETFISMEKYLQALEQLEQISVSIEAMDGSVDESILSLVNQDNKLGKLLGVYLPPSLRFEMAEATAAATTPPVTANPANATPAEKKEAGSSLTDRIKETAKKMWEVLKGFFAKIANGLKSFWQWIRHGFKSNKDFNAKLAADIEPLSEEQVNAVLMAAQGYLRPEDFPAAKALFDNLFNVPFIKKLEDRNCESVILNMEKDGTFTANLTTLVGLSEEDLKKSFVKVTPAAGADRLPKLELDKEGLKAKKANKATMKTLGWNKNFLRQLLTDVNAYYSNVEKTEGIPGFVDAAQSFDWENSKLVKPDQAGKVPDLATIKAEVQSVLKFYTQLNKLYLICCDPWQDHLDAIRKYMGEAAKVQAAQPQTPAPTQPAVNPAATATQTTGVPA